MGTKNSKNKRASSNPFDSPSKLTHYKKGKPQFVIENTSLVYSKSSINSYSFFRIPCFQADNHQCETEWKVLFYNRCSELKKHNFWAQKFKKLLKKFRQTVPDEYFLGSFQDIEPPTKVLSEKKQLEFLENSSNLESINNGNNEKTPLFASSEKTIMKNSNEDYHKKIKKILSSTEILDDHFHSDQLKADFLKHSPSNNNMMSESKASNKYLEDYKSRRFSFENNDRAKGSFLWTRNSLDNTKDQLHFKNNTFVIDYQTFLTNMSNAGEAQNLKSEEKYRFIKHYKLVTEKIESQLKDSQNPLGYLFLCFRGLFETEFENKMILYDNNKANIDKYGEIFEEAVSNIKDMIRLMQEALFLYYNLKKFKDDNQSIFLFTKDNILNFITSLTFENDYIYEYLLTLQKDIDVFKEISIIKSMEKMKNFKPNDFGINERISLNNDTINFFKNLKENTFEKSNFKNKKDEIDLQFYQPYKKAIQNLRLIETMKSPLHKLKVILKCAESILKSIRRFYEENDRVFSENISGDEILTIFIYIINKANVPFLISHCNLIEKFITNQLSFSISGYYFSTIMAALSFIENKTWKKEEI